MVQKGGTVIMHHTFGALALASPGRHRPVPPNVKRQTATRPATSTRFDTATRRSPSRPVTLLLRRLQISKRADVGGGCLFRQMVDREEREKKLGDPVCFL